MAEFNNHKSKQICICALASSGAQAHLAGVFYKVSPVVSSGCGPGWEELKPLIQSLSSLPRLSSLGPGTRDPFLGSPPRELSRPSGHLPSRPLTYHNLCVSAARLSFWVLGFRNQKPHLSCPGVISLLMNEQGHLSITCRRPTPVTVQCWLCGL